MNAGTLTDTSANDSFGNLTGTLVGQDADFGETATLTYAALDAAHNNNPVTTAVAGQYGSLTVNANGTYTYVADAAKINALHAGTYADTFTVQTADVNGATKSALFTVNVTGANDTPTLAAVNAGTLTDTSASDSFGNLTGTLLGQDADSGETATLTYAALDAAHNNNPVTTAVTGQYGSLTVNASGTYTYVADAAKINALQVGSYADTFTVQTADVNGATKTALFTVNVNGANDAPVAHDDAISNASPPAAGWVLDTDNGHYYRYVATSVTFANAQSGAASDGAYLATITSAGENSFISSLIGSGHTGWTSGHTTNANPNGTAPLTDTATYTWTAGPKPATCSPIPTGTPASPMADLA